LLHVLCGNEIGFDERERQVFCHFSEWLCHERFLVVP
jgi:hypothetical protein